MSAVIEVKNLCCQSGNQFLLKDINWQVQKGERWVVFGRNGCGKTTLLSIIAGVRDYTAGSLQVLGETYHDANIFALRRKIGWVSSSFYEKIYSKERVSDIILSGTTGGFGLDVQIDNQDIKKLKQVAKYFDLTEKLFHPYHLLSKGERQKVLLARAFIGEAQLLILDEPCSGLDVIAREHILEQVQRLAEDIHKTLIYVTHYPEEILKSFDKCLLIKHGQVYAQGETEMIFVQEHLRGLFEEDILLRRDDGRYHIVRAKEKCLIC